MEWKEVRLGMYVLEYVAVELQRVLIFHTMGRNSLVEYKRDRFQ